jgi:hypothetical protein
MLVAKYFTSSLRPLRHGAPYANRTPSDPKRRAQLQKVEMMKIRHRAIPGDPKDKPSSVDQRLHVHVRLDDPSFPGKDGIFWFRQVSYTLPARVGEFDPILSVDCGNWESLRPSCHPSRNTVIRFICKFPVGFMVAMYDIFV